MRTSVVPLVTATFAVAALVPDRVQSVTATIATVAVVPGRVLPPHSADRIRHLLLNPSRVP